jgi:hypothetical protein
MENNIESLKNSNINHDDVIELGVASIETKGGSHAGMENRGKSSGGWANDGSFEKDLGI